MEYRKRERARPFCVLFSHNHAAPCLPPPQRVLSLVENLEIGKRLIIHHTTFFYAQNNAKGTLVTINNKRGKGEIAQNNIKVENGISQCLH